MEFEAHLGREARGVLTVAAWKPPARGSPTMSEEHKRVFGLVGKPGGGKAQFFQMGAADAFGGQFLGQDAAADTREIGRASCRERV